MIKKTRNVSATALYVGSAGMGPNYFIISLDISIEDLIATPC